MPAIEVIKEATLSLHCRRQLGESDHWVQELFRAHLDSTSSPTQATPCSSNRAK